MTDPTQTDYCFSTRKRVPTATYCNVLQHTATHCSDSTQQYNSAHTEKGGHTQKDQKPYTKRLRIHTIKIHSKQINAPLVLRVYMGALKKNKNGWSYKKWSTILHQENTAPQKKRPTIVHKETKNPQKRWAVRFSCARSCLRARRCAHARANAQRAIFLLKRAL